MERGVIAMSELKTVVVLDGEIINVGEWDYQYIEQINDDGTASQIPQNPLPDVATIEQREMVYSVDKGWQLANAIQTPSQEDVLSAKIQLEALNLLIELGVI